MPPLASPTPARPARRKPPGVFEQLVVRQDLEFWVRTINPLWSLWESRARICAIVSETPTIKTFVLQPNRHWRGFEAGQFVPLFVEINGVRERRCYSISSAPGKGRRFTVTIGRREGGLVSTWLHDRAKVGDVLPIGAAAGEFLLPPDLPRPLLFVSGGTGLTPVMAHLLALAERRALHEVVALHFVRTAADLAFGERLRALEHEFPGFKFHLRETRRPAANEHLNEERLHALVPDWQQRLTYFCGPPSLMSAGQAIWSTAGASARLRTESFGSPRTLEPRPGMGIGGARITLAESGVEFQSSSTGTLLEQVERAGLRPEFGCRIGICHSCKCRKQTGAVANLRTGETSAADEEDIQLCISVPCSDVVLRL